MFKQFVLGKVEGISVVRYFMVYYQFTFVILFIFMSETQKLVQGKNIALITAHPDDEAMFFTPTLLHLKENGYNVSLLCLCKGRNKI